MKANVIFPENGRHNQFMENSVARLIRGNTYKDLSTVCIIPTRGMIHCRVLQSWFSMLTPMNQKFLRLFGSNMEVADSYNTMIEMILANPELAKWKYILTLEEDNMPPPDGLLKLYESMEQGFDVVGGLYWTKGEGGQPMIYGNPVEMPLNFIPQVPLADALQRCNGLGMGFNLFKMKIFKDADLPKPWFKTCSDFIPGQGSKVYTQDLYFFENAGRAGYKFACDTRVKVGHYDMQTDIVW